MDCREQILQLSQSSEPAAVASYTGLTICKTRIVKIRYAQITVSSPKHPQSKMSQVVAIGDPVGIISSPGPTSAPTPMLMYYEAYIGQDLGDFLQTRTI